MSRTSPAPTPHPTESSGPPPRALTPRLRWWLGCGLLLALHGILLAAVSLPAPHSGGDNAAYLSLASSLASGTGYTELWDPLAPPHAKYPPAYPLLLALVMALGATTWGAFKLLSAFLVAGAGVLVLSWAAARRGLPLALAVALLSVLSSGWVEASRWVLSEPLFLVAVFLALWGADRAGLRASWPRRRPRGVRGDGADPPPGASLPWLVLACAGALLTLFTRTAGLPLLLALLLLLGWERRWKGLALTLGVAMLPVLLWINRGRAAGEGAYQDEFWMANPYDPEQGVVGVGGLLARMVANLEIYLGRVLGREWWGGVEGLAGLGWLLAGALALLALVGWVRRVRRGDGGLAELFFPLYTGLILLWPSVWAGDRFVLPLYPLLLFWAGEAVVDAWRAAGGRAASGVAAALLAVGLLALPAVAGVMDRVRVSEACRSVGSIDPFACYGEAFQGFRDAAAWSGLNLPDGAVVINRKPRIFHALGGTPGRVFPFFEEAGPLLDQATELNARYLLVDQWDGVSRRYLPAIINDDPGAFCGIRAWGGSTVLLGILPPDARPETPLTPEGTLHPCPEGPEPWLAAGEERRPPLGTAQVPVVINPPGRRPR